MSRSVLFLLVFSIACGPDERANRRGSSGLVEDAAGDAGPELDGGPEDAGEDGGPDGGGLDGSADAGPTCGYGPGIACCETGPECAGHMGCFYGSCAACSGPVGCDTCGQAGQVCCRRESGGWGCRGSSTPTGPHPDVECRCQ